MVSFRIMIVLYFSCIISIALSDELNENVKNSNEQNTTTLYPVKNITFYFNDLKVHKNISNAEERSNDEKSDVANYKNNTQTDLDQFKVLYADKPLILLNSNESKISDMNNDTMIPSTEDKVKSIDLKEGTRWKIDATYAPTKSIDGAHDESKSKNFMTEDNMKDFKPSPHLGSFYDEDSFVVATPATERSFIPYTPQTFESVEKDFFKINYKRPVDSYQTPIDTPYRFENVPRTPDYRSTVEPPVKIPAGGLYKLSDAFQETPSSDGDNDGFGIEFKDQKNNSVKNRGNPWKSFLHMVTSLLPVGLIISALTPSVITFDTAGNNNPLYPSRLSRRVDGVSSTPPISERCKRRLLCEIHADQNYISDISISQRKQCYKLRCEDPLTMNALLRWLLDHHHYHHTHRRPGYRPADHDRRGYIIGNKYI